MEFTDVLRRRRMVRRFDPERPVPDSALLRAVRNATRAPSAGFSQGWDFVVLTEPADRQAFWSVTSHQPGQSSPAAADSWLRSVQTAPALVLCCSDELAYDRRYAEDDKRGRDRRPSGSAGPAARRWAVPYWHVDTGMAALLILLTAVDEGLGALFFGVPHDRHDAVLRQFDIPGDRAVVGVVALGYAVPGGPAGSAVRRRRRPLADVAHAGRFGVPYPPAPTSPLMPGRQTGMRARAADRPGTAVDRPTPSTDCAAHVAGRLSPGVVADPRLTRAA